MKRRVLTLCLTLALCLSLTSTAFAASAYDRPGQKLAALTFDDGPSAQSAQILDVLARHEAKATFFMNSHSYQRYADQIRRMVREGHQIGNHTLNHPELSKCSDALIRQEVGGMAQALTQVTGLAGTGDTGFYLRPPFGSMNKGAAAVAGVPVIMWSVDSMDWSHKSVSHLVNQVGSEIRNGDIILVHETVKTTAQGLDALLTKLESRGFELVTVEELFWRRGITPQAGQIYYHAKNTGVDLCPRALYWDESRLDTHWAWESISYVREHGLMTGNEYGEFTPQFPLTRGMFVTILGRLSGVAAGETPSGFTDIPDDHYAAPYAAWARKTGIMVGLETGAFGVDSPLTRQQMAVALARYAQFRGAAAGDFDLSAYPDQVEIADWARAGVAQCSALGLLQGSDVGFQPNKATNRAMGAVILHRLCEYDFSA